MSKHTEGPWQQVVGDGAGSHWNIHQKTPTIDGGFFCRVDALHVTEEARGIARANAKLIAAAPELLEVLKKLTAQFESTPNKDAVLVAYSLIQKGQSIINKAEGRNA